MRCAGALRKAARDGIERRIPARPLTPSSSGRPQRVATPFDARPRSLIRDNDATYGPAFARVADAIGITALRTAYRPPRQNVACERYRGSVRRECLDQPLAEDEGHLRRVLREYAHHFNRDQPHHGLAQRIPEARIGTTHA